MRNPNRIPIILNQLEELWKEHPDMRLGQLLVNIVHNMNQASIEVYNIFYVEDDKISDEIVNIIREGF